MSEFCDFIPDDERCQVEEPEDMGGKGGMDGGMDGGMEENMEKGDMGKEMMEANLTFLMVALGSFIHTALQMFRYRSAETYYDWGELSVNTMTNYWSLLNMAGGYWILVLTGILTITQLLSMFGVAAEINLMAWMYLGSADMIISMVLGLIWMYAYDAYYTVSADSTADSTDMGLASTVMGLMEAEMTKATAVGTMHSFMLYTNAEMWMHAQFNALSEEAQAEWKEGMKGDGKKGDGKKGEGMMEEAMHVYFGI